MSNLELVSFFFILYLNSSTSLSQSWRCTKGRILSALQEPLFKSSHKCLFTHFFYSTNVQIEMHAACFIFGRSDAATIISPRYTSV